jgi:hypothetical protein
MLDVQTPSRPAAVRTAFVVLRRGAVAFGVAVVISAVTRFLPHGRTPARHGGWRELPLSELRD